MCMIVCLDSGLVQDFFFLTNMNSFQNFFYEITPLPPPLPAEVKWLAPFIVKENPLKNAILLLAVQVLRIFSVVKYKQWM